MEDIFLHSEYRYYNSHILFQKDHRIFNIYIVYLLIFQNSSLMIFPGILMEFSKTKKYSRPGSLLGDGNLIPHLSQYDDTKQTNQNNLTNLNNLILKISNLVFYQQITRILFLYKS